MLVLKRKSGESIRIGDDIIVKIVRMRGDSCQVKIIAPRHVPVFREEIYERMKEEGEEPNAAV